MSIKVTPNCRHYTIYGILEDGTREALARDKPEGHAQRLLDALQDRVAAGNLYDYLGHSQVVRLEMVAGDWK
jgi:hypothetical protein